MRFQRRSCAACDTGSNARLFRRISHIATVTQPDLFDAPIVPGLSLTSGVIDADQEAALIARINAVALTPFRFQQWTGHRLTHSFGWNYDFQTGELSPAAPVPDWLEPLRIGAAAAAGLSPGALVQALLIRYDPGAGIGWHRDRPVYEHVVGISLGAPATMRLRRREGERWRRASVALVPRDLYHLSGEVRHQWEHSIIPQNATRWSITFRSFAFGARRVL